MKKIFLCISLCFIFVFNVTAQDINILKTKAENGDMFACRYLGNGYLNGTTPFTKDVEEGFKWIKKAAELGDDDSQLHMAYLYWTGNYKGMEIQRDESLARFWVKKASLSGKNKDAIYLQALFDHQDQNFNEAYNGFLILNEKYNLPESNYFLGMYHYLEYGKQTFISPDSEENTKINTEKARVYLTKCIELEGDLDGMAHSMLFSLLTEDYNIDNSKYDKTLINNLDKIVEDGLSKFPDYMNLYYNKGELYLIKKDTEKAKKIWEYIKNIDPDALNSNSLLSVAFGGSIDYLIPITNQTNDHTIAVVIANENYKRVPNVPFAINDGNIFSHYLINTFGIPEDNINLLLDASINDIRFSINNISQKCGANPGEYSVIVYYAGHGVPNENNGEAYLLPVDGFGTDPSSGIKLDDFYSSLSELKAKSVIVILDACFSGASRDGASLMATRGITIKPKMGVPDGNLIVLAAASNDETAFPIEEQKHGLFTYTLLRKIQESEGNITLGELADYVNLNVKQKSMNLIGKTQTPTVTVSPSIKETWRSIRIK